MAPPMEPMEMSLIGMSSVLFEGFKPIISRMEGPPMIRIMQYSTEPSMEERDGKLVISSGGCSIQEGITTIAPTSEEEELSPEEEEEEEVAVMEEEQEETEVAEGEEASGATAGLSSWRLASMSYAAGAAAFVSLMDGGVATASIVGLAAWSLPGVVAQEELACEQGMLYRVCSCHFNPSPQV